VFPEDRTWLALLRAEQLVRGHEVKRCRAVWIGQITTRLRDLPVELVACRAGPRELAQRLDDTVAHGLGVGREQVCSEGKMYELPRQRLVHPVDAVAQAALEAKAASEAAVGDRGSLDERRAPRSEAGE
jgi:hypothetical protein